MDRRRWLLLLGSIAVGATAFLVLRRPPCPPAAQKLATVWDADRRLELQRSLAGNRPALKAIEAAFDGFATHWSAGWDQSCADRDATAPALARQRLCLDGRLAQLAALSELFSRAEPAVVNNAVLVVERLNAFGPCNEQIAEVPGRGRAQLALAQRKIARSDVLRRTGKHPDALAAANEALALAQAAKYPPLIAQALLERAEEERATGKPEAAEATLAQAQVAAEAGQDFETLTRICVSHLVLLGSQPQRAAKADGWVKRAEEALAHLPHPALQADLELTVAMLRMEQHRPADAEPAARRARKLFETNHQTARMLDATGLLGQALLAQGKFDEAIVQAQALLAGRLGLLGEDHPQTLRARIGVGETLLKAGRSEEALAALEPLAEAQLAGLPPVAAATALCSRGTARTRLRSALGLEDLKRCVALMAGALGEQSPSTAGAHDALAAGWRLQADLRHAVDEHERAIAAFGTQRSAATASAHASYAVTLLAQADASAAHQRAKLALAIFDQLPADQAIDPCPALWALAEAGTRLKKPSAQADARAALGCLANQPRRGAELGRAALTLATLLGKTPEAIDLLKTAATDPSVQLVALDALAALRPFDPEAGCAAAIEALVRAPTEAREKAAKGCKLPRLP
ncbi:MAG: Serine/threonine kinase [Myxococcaceae bacterium]|nr:Serine/threonine kinase [Myxococcaceae bacterium]